MRLLTVVLISGLLVACQHPVEVRGLYVTDHGPGTFVACDDPKTIVRVGDAALAAMYRRTATRPYQLLFVRLRGVRADSGSIYYGQHHFLVRQILELRAPRAGECKDGITPVPSWLPPVTPSSSNRRLPQTEVPS